MTTTSRARRSRPPGASWLDVLMPGASRPGGLVPGAARPEAVLPAVLLPRARRALASTALRALPPESLRPASAGSALSEPRRATRGDVAPSAAGEVEGVVA